MNPEPSEAVREKVARAIANALGDQACKPISIRPIADAAIEVINAERDIEGCDWYSITGVLCGKRAGHSGPCARSSGSAAQPLMAPDPDVSGTDDYEGDQGPQKVSSGSAAQDHKAGRWPMQDYSAEARAAAIRGEQPARSPQGEDHEAGMRAMGALLRDWDRNGGYMPTVKQLADAYRDAALSRVSAPEHRYSVRTINPRGTFGIRDNLYPESQVQAIFSTREQAQEVVDRRNGVSAPERDTVRLVEALARMIGLVEGFAKGIEARGWALPEVTAEMYAETAKAREALAEFPVSGESENER